MNFVDRLGLAWAAIIGGWILFTLALGNDTPLDKLWGIFFMIAVAPWLVLKVLSLVFVKRAR